MTLCKLCFRFEKRLLVMMPEKVSYIIDEHFIKFAAEWWYFHVAYCRLFHINIKTSAISPYYRDINGIYISIDNDVRLCARAKLHAASPRVTNLFLDTLLRISFSSAPMMIYTHWEHHHAAYMMGPLAQIWSYYSGIPANASRYKAPCRHEFIRCIEHRAYLPHAPSYRSHPAGGMKINWFRSGLLAYAFIAHLQNDGNTATSWRGYRFCDMFMMAEARRIRLIYFQRLRMRRRLSTLIRRRGRVRAIFSDI